MKTLYIECNMGAAGDMLLASLAELTGDVKSSEEKLNSLGIPDVTYNFERAVKCGIEGTHARVVALGVEEDEHMHEHEHDHSHHGHTHEHITAFESTEQAVMILGYMLDHNRSHAEELHEIRHRLEATGEEEAAEYLDRAVDSFREGNDLMDKALRILKKEEE